MLRRIKIFSRSGLAISLFGILASSAFAGSLTLLGAGGPAAVTPPSYAGPGNIVSGALGWYGLRAYSTAIAAAGTQTIVDLRRISDNATCTAKIATSGYVDLTVGAPCNSNTQTVTAWANNDSSCTGAIATTTLTVASCTKGNLIVGLPITDANITSGTVITALGTGSGGAGTYTVNISQTAGSAVFTAPGYAAASKIYDQSASSKDALQATAGNQPILIFDCGLGFPCLMTRTSGMSLQTSGNVTPATGIGSISGVACVKGAPSTSYVLGTGGGSVAAIFSTNSANTWRITGGTSGSISPTANDLTCHAANGVITNSSSSFLNIDGASTSGTLVGATSAGVQSAIFGGSTIYYWQESGYWDNISFTSGNANSINTQQHSAWGF